MRLRHMLAALLSATLVLSGCGLGAGPSEDTAFSDATSVPDTAVDTTTAAPTTPATDTGEGEVVTIGFGAQEWERQVFEPLIEAFNNENPDVRVQFVSLDEVLNFGPDQPYDPSEAMRRIVSAADTAAYWSVSPEDIKNGYVYDLMPLIEADPAFDRDDFYPAALAAASQEGGIYMVPRSVTVSLLSYNRDLWARRGVPAPKPDWTWADLVAAAEQLAEKRGDEVEIYGLVSWDSGFTALFGELAQAGINLFASPSDQVRLDRPEIAAALQRVATLAQSGAIYYQSPAESQSFNPEDMRKLILDQRAGMWSPEMLFAGPGEPPPAFEVGTAPLPVLGLPFASSTEGYIMSSGTQHPEAAWRWLSFLSRQAVRRPFEGPGSISQVPARRSVAESSGYWKQLDAEAAAAVQAVLARPAAPPPPGAFDGRVYQPLSTALAAVVRGEQSAEQALDEAQAALEQQIAQAQSTPSPVPASGPIVVATPVPEVVPEGATVVTFGTLSFGFGQLRQIARTFNQNHPEVFVQIKNTDALTGPVSLRDIASQVDCFAWWGPPESGEFTATLDLQPLIDADASANAGTPFLNDYPPALLAPFQHENGLYGLPYAVNFRVLAYNKDAFEAAGLQPPRADWTINDFIAAAQQLTSGSGKDKRYGYAALGSQVQDLVFFLERLGASPITGSGEEQQPNFTDPQVVQAINTYLDLLRTTSPHERIEGYTRGGWGGDTYQLIAEGRVGMWLDFGNFLLFGGPQEQPFTRAIAPPPFGDRPATADDFYARGLFISATTQHPEACWAWLKHLSTDISVLEGGFPARISVAESEAFVQQAPPGAAEVYQAYRQALQHAPNSADQRRSILRSEIDLFWFFRAIDRALQSQAPSASPGQALERELADAQATTERFLACVGSGGAGHVCAKQVDPQYEGWRNAEPEPSDR